MKTFLKVSLLGLLAFVVYQFRSIILAPIALALGVSLVGGAIFTVGVLAFLGVGAGVIFAVLGVLLAILLALSPILVPALVIWGVVALVRRNKSRSTSVVATAV